VNGSLVVIVHKYGFSTRDETFPDVLLRREKRFFWQGISKVFQLFAFIRMKNNKQL
jgi:hypothetical protein